jgi:hypothetical protein
MEVQDIAVAAIKGELGVSEKLIWSGVPRHGIVVRNTDAFAIPFSLLWGGFALFWENGVITSNAPFFFRLWGIPFVLIGIYIVIGRFFADALRRGQTYYGVTNDRIVIVSRLFQRNVKSLDLRTLGELTLQEDSSGNGTITFGQPNPWWQGLLGSGDGRNSAPCLEMIPDVKSVYQRILVAQRSAK